MLVFLGWSNHKSKHNITFSRSVLIVFIVELGKTPLYVKNVLEKHLNTVMQNQYKIGMSWCARLMHMKSNEKLFSFNQ